MSLAHRDLQTFRTPLVLGQRKFSANWSRALILGTLVFATLNSSWAQDAGAVTTGKPNPIYQTSHKSRFNGIMPAPRTDLAHLFVVEQEAEEDQTT